MEPKHVIDLIGTMCPEPAEEAFNRWYDEKHIPLSMKFKGLSGIVRYKLQRANGLGTVKEYPKHLTFYSFKDLAALKAWNSSPELEAANKEAPDLFGRLGVEILWRARYESLRTWQSTPPSCVVDIIGMLPTPETEARLNEWYNTRHVPDVLKCKGSLGATRYRLLNTDSPGKSSFQIKTQRYPQYLAIYYWKDLPAAEAIDTSPERAIAYQGWIDIEKEIAVERMWRVRYSPVMAWQKYL